ncbi:MAG: ECF transporter S component [Lachnospiraceae bacterium]|nr:ECF transporter S component [Lachnospiraceae bacterium]
MNKTTDRKTMKLVMSALFAALNVIGTLIHIPAGPTLGYVHLGDAFVILSGILLGPMYGGIAAGIGSGIADVINGYAIYVPGTIVIKFLEAMIAGLIFARFYDKDHAKKFDSQILTAISGCAGGIIMIVFYFLYEILIINLAESASDIKSALVAAAAGVPYNVAQALIAIILAVIAYPIFKRVDFKS